VTGYLKDLLHL